MNMKGPSQKPEFLSTRPVTLQTVSSRSHWCFSVCVSGSAPRKPRTRKPRARGTRRPDDHRRHAAARRQHKAAGRGRRSRRGRQAANMARRGWRFVPQMSVIGVVLMNTPSKLNPARPYQLIKCIRRCYPSLNTVVRPVRLTLE